MLVYVLDEFGPEATAMLQALYSRSSKSVVEHIKKVKQTGSDKFMESYYIGYGHSSIGDCGTTTVFIEDVSILATKVVQDNPLYSGQESSTRYLDFSKQRIVNPTNSDLGGKIQERWIDFYLSYRELLVSFLEERFSLQKNQSESVWRKAIQARSFDILRGFLPTGVCTQFSWTTNLRQASDNLIRLTTHPLIEVRSLAIQIHEELQKRYPSSFSHSADEQRNEYLRGFYAEHAFLKQKVDAREFVAESVLKDNIPVDLISAIVERPLKTVLPRNIANVARYRIQCLLDYGSFRDIQRHRNAYCPIPLLAPIIGFNTWYLDQLPPTIRVAARNLINIQEQDFARLRSDGVSDFDLQYYIPMGYNVYVELECDLSEILYIAELRSGRSVHPTLRKLAWQIATFIETQIPGIKVYSDRSTDEFDIRRGMQTIIEKVL